MTETKATKKTAPKAAKAGKTLVVVQIASGAGALAAAKGTLAGLGLGKVNARRELQDTPAVRGMVYKVRHLVRIEGEKA